MKQAAQACRWDAGDVLRHHQAGLLLTKEAENRAQPHVPLLLDSARFQRRRKYIQGGAAGACHVHSRTAQAPPWRLHCITEYDSSGLQAI